MAVKNIRTIVAQMKQLSDENRYKLLQEVMAGHANNPAELTWRAKLCTALEKAHVYPHGPDEENGA